MIRLKDTVAPKSLVIVAAIANVAETWQRTVWITSGNDSTHGARSLHPKDRAVDARSKDFADGQQKRAFLKAVLDRLGPDYEGILEAEGKANEHFHVEHDPKDH
jgi:hypothetical protein